jgi:hypothetical protein
VEQGRFTWRHNTVLGILAIWLRDRCGENSLAIDLPGWPSPSLYFDKHWPDVVLKLEPGNEIVAIELTVCHELNIENAKQRKREKYSNLRTRANQRVKLFTVEITVLGLYSVDQLLKIQAYISPLRSKKITDQVLSRLAGSAMRTSFFIYCRRDKDWPQPELLNI